MEEKVHFFLDEQPPCLPANLTDLTRIAPLYTTDSRPASIYLVKTIFFHFPLHLNMSQTFCPNLEQFFSPHLVVIYRAFPYTWAVRREMSNS